MPKRTRQTTIEESLEKPKFKAAGSPNIRIRSNCFAWNNYTEENITNYKIFVQTHCSYGVFGKEICPTTGTPHLQCYFELRSQKSQMQIQKLLEYNIHFAGKTRDPPRAAEYCKEDGDFWEHGKQHNQGQRSDLIELKDKLLAGDTTVNDIVELEPMTYHQYGRTLEKIEQLRLNRTFRTWETAGVWYFGPTGVGKSHKAFEGYQPETHYLWNIQEEFQCGYVGQPIVIINDFRGEIKYSILLQMIDKWPFSLKRKGGGVIPFLAEKVIITSSLHPKDCYPRTCAKDSIEQLLRRVEIVRLEENRAISSQKSSKGNTRTFEDNVEFY